MMIKRILKKIKRQFQSQREKFKEQLLSNNLIINVENKNNDYYAKLKDCSILIRDFKHSDYSVFCQIFNKKEYEILINIYHLNILNFEKTIIIDAGANVGYTSIFFLNKLDNAKIFGIEPSKTNMEMYKKNIILNDYSENVIFYENALCGVVNKKFNIDRSFRDGLDWGLFTQEDEFGLIRGITLNQIIFENKLNYISILKIDIEGAERFIFKEDGDLEFLNITKIIALEIHDEFNIRNTINEILYKRNFVLIESGELTIGININLLNKFK
jgi:FkbM family methyltransferase